MKQIEGGSYEEKTIDRCSVMRGSCGRNAGRLRPEGRNDRNGRRTDCGGKPEGDSGREEG